MRYNSIELRIIFLLANCGRSTAEVDKYYFQTIIYVEKLSLAYDHVTYMVINVQSQYINGKDLQNNRVYERA